MSDQVKATYTCKEPATKIRNACYENQSGLVTDAQQEDKHDHTGGLPANQRDLSQVSGTRAPERHKREGAVLFARVSVGLEGFVPSKKAEMDAQRFIEGEITLSEFVGSK